MKGNYVMLRAGGLRLLLAQQDVGAAEYVDAAAMPDGVVALSERMQPLSPLPRDRFVVTRLGPRDAGVPFAWDEVRVLIDADVQRHPLPPVMRIDGAPIDGYVELEGELLLCTQARHVLAAASQQ